MFIHRVFCLCPLCRSIKLNFNIAVESELHTYIFMSFLIGQVTIWQPRGWGGPAMVFSKELMIRSSYDLKCLDGFKPRLVSVR